MDNDPIQERLRAFKERAEETKKKLLDTRLSRALIGIFLFLLLLGVLYWSVYRPPARFPEGHVVEIREGMTVMEIADLLHEERIIRSPFVFRTLVRVLGEKRIAVAGDYYFDRERTAGTVAWRIAQGEFGLEPLRVTVPEGASTLEIAEIFAARFSAFNPDTFLRLTYGKEGFLFPDTYFFLPNVDAERVVQRMEGTFFEKIQELEPAFASSTHSLHDIVTMASLVEREANTSESRRIVAGILWNRIEKEMPLQVDVTFDFINGKNTFDLTIEDLLLEHPYNTYTRVGLPPGPIANPGLDAIAAALQPEESDYFYFLADGQGIIHYSETFEEHKRKKEAYLK